ncbi:hypothetical protein NEMBOFW57_009195 [Staphylotrichum longicolle]|uniref:Uncharacterized protein n=1 Tax=Staphylotrichum longicolle TaxID=669026 RepID=A0AAD4HWG9_9PEZI|nr:hypothetical protein NEMBOFW57_009195 [Staphylotrichum longicolle]
MASSSPLSDVSRARRDAILDEIRSRTEYSLAAVARQLEDEVPPMVLARAEADDRPRMSADWLHWRVDAKVWLSYFPDEEDEFRRRFPKPSTGGPSCPEYEPYRARVLERRRREREQAATVQDIPTDLWQTLDFLDTQDLGITEWCITLPPSIVSVDALIPGLVDGAVSPWASPLVVRVERRAAYSLTLRWRVDKDTPEARKLACGAWMDLVGWCYDLRAGSHFALPAWIEKAKTRGVQRDAASLRRLVEADGREKKYRAAVTKFRLQGMLPADRETGGYSVPIIRDRMEKWWVAELLHATGLDEARHRNVGWWAWHDEVSGPDRRRRSPAEADEIVRLYEKTGIAVPILEDSVRRLFELTSGPFGSVDRTLQVVEAWATANPERLILPRASLRCLAVAMVHRLAPEDDRAHIEAYYETLFPAAAALFVDRLAGDGDDVRLELVRWLRENPDQHLGSMGKRAGVVFDLWQAKLQC